MNLDWLLGRSKVSEPGATDIPGGLAWDGSNGPLTIRDYNKLQVDPRLERSALTMRPFGELLAPRMELDDGAIVMRDLKTIGIAWELVSADVDGRSPEYVADLERKVQQVLTSAIPQDDNPWLLQIQLHDDPGLQSLQEDIERYAEKHRETDYTKHWLDVMAQHCKDVATPGGLFKDDEITGEQWNGQRRRVHMFLWRPGDNSDSHSITDVATRLETGLIQSGVKLRRINGADFYERLSNWFAPVPFHFYDEEEFDGVSKPSVPTWPTSSKLRHLAMADPNESAGADFIMALQGCSPVSTEGGVWWFSGRPHRYLPVEFPVSEPKPGLITAEGKHGKHRYAIWDRLPEGAVWSTTLAFVPHDVIEGHINSIIKASVGDSAEAKAQNKRASDALEHIALADDPMIRMSAGIYLRAENLRELKRRELACNALFESNGFRLVIPDDNPIAQDDYIRNLPFGFDFNHDRKPWVKRARLWYASHATSVLPMLGRSHGTGTPGSIQFNRGGEPLTFDPLAPTDRQKNAHLFLFGPTGSGKTAYLIGQILHTMAMHRPRLFLITSLPTFELLGQHFSTHGLSVHYVRYAPEEDISTPPFGNALRLLDGEEDVGDLLGQMELSARLMVTGGDPDEDKKLGRDGLTHLRSAIERAAITVREEKRDTVLTEDVANALMDIADELGGEQQTDLQRRAIAMRRYTSGFLGKLFNRPGTEWPDADVTIVNMGTLARRGSEDQLAVAMTGLMSHIHDGLERNQYDGRHTVVTMDEGHVLLKNPLVGPNINGYVAQWRTLGGWFWLSTQNLHQIPESTKELLNQPEWWICLAMDADQVSYIRKFKELSTEQEHMLKATRKARGKYTEGVVIADKVLSLFRSVPPALALALAQTEPEEKQVRAEIMLSKGVSEIEAAYLIAEEIAASRRSGGK